MKQHGTHRGHCQVCGRIHVVIEGLVKEREAIKARPVIK